LPSVVAVGNISMSTNKRQGYLLTSQPSHVDLVVLAVYLCGGGAKAVDTEDAAVEAFRLAPSRFSWRKHPEQINLELVRVSLSDGKKPEKGALLDGSGKTGWTLTPAGLRWAKDAEASLLSEDLSRSRQEGRGGSIDEQRWRRERDRILSTRAWANWSNGEREIAPRDAAEVYRIDSYAVGRMRSLKITRLKSLFATDQTVLPFLSHLEQVITSSRKDDADTRP
jgi:hypothetical protein